MIEVGEVAPGFTIPGSDGESIRDYSLADITEEGPAVLCFYPFDFSPVCTDQLCTFRDLEWLTFTEGLDVVGISSDSAHAHKRFIQEYDLEFPLLTDRHGDVADEYGLLMDEFERHPNIPKRGIVVVDDTRTVRSVWRPETQYVSPTVEEVEATIDWYRSPGHS